MTIDPLQSAVYATFRNFGVVGASYPVFFKPPGRYEVVAAEELLRAESLRRYFTRAVNEWSEHPSDEDQRAAASRFLRRYAGSLVGASLMSLSGGVALDVAIPRVRLLIRNDLTLGTVIDLAGAAVYVSPARPTLWPIAGVSVPSIDQLRRHACENLFRDHLVPALERIYDVVGISRKLMWSTVAGSIEYMYGTARPYFDDAGWAPLAEDRATIHFAATVPGIDGPNPMKGLIEWEDFGDPDLPGPLPLRRVCCINYVIPGRGMAQAGGYCRGCGLLPVETRHQLWRDYVARQRLQTSCQWPPLG